jgi:lipopolysaccharide transport system ATP-binding protein
MKRVVIRIDGLGKKFRLGARQASYQTLRSSLSHVVTSSFHRAAAVLRGHSTDASDDEIWALQKVSFEVHQGEVFGIIGRNGSGKSTLLKILSRITEPTQGRVDIKGRVGSLLEVGTGFHPELTGRENVYLNGAILGMRKKEIDGQFDEIVQFAELEKFLDTPVKHYSSGMYMRLAFAVAAHMETEILLLDEVLAVGDAAFQKKCLGKMDDVARQGRTVLFVSHNLLAVQNLCHRVLWLNNGQNTQIGPPDQIVANYLKTSLKTNTERVWKDPVTAPGNEQVRLRRVCVRLVDGTSADPITVHTPFVFEFEYWNLKASKDFYLGVELYDSKQILLFDSGALRCSRGPGVYRQSCSIPGDLLNNGSYRVVLVLGTGYGKELHREDNVLVFDIQDDRDPEVGYYGTWKGAIRPMLEWKAIELDSGTFASSIVPLISSAHTARNES